MFSKKTIKNVAIKNQTILLRTDYNVPLDEAGKITDDLRIRASLPTIEYLLSQKPAKIIIVSHLGRPEGRPDKSLSLAPVATRLQELLPQVPVTFVSEHCGPEVEEHIDRIKKGSIVLLENLRFSPDEERNSSDFASELFDSVHPDLFVQDAFATLHRAHASTSAITELLPSVAGLLVEKEVSSLLAASENPTHPLLLILGGAKVADKQPLIDKFTSIADHITIAGKIAADGYQPTAPNITTATGFVEDSAGAKLDIDPDSTAKIIDLINSSKTIIWNGLTGEAEKPEFAASSIAVAESIGQKKDATTIICGGDTSGFVENMVKTNPSLTYTLISTGGGASLELLSGLPLPGLDALEEK